MDLGFKDFIGLGTTGILSLLWFDIRGIRKERTKMNKDIDKTYLISLNTERDCLQFVYG